MSLNKKILFVMLTIGGIAFLPYAGAIVCFGPTLPNNYFAYPPLTVPPKAGFSEVVFITVAILFGLAILLYIFPRLFGFKKFIEDHVTAPPKASFPIWAWIGLLMWGGTLFVLWMHFTGPGWLLRWADLPLFWGFTLVIDGIVFVRTGGNSIIGKSSRDIIGIGLASVWGWLLFEYLNFYVDDNWYYPKGNLIPMNEFTIYAVLGSSGLLPMAFEWYNLLVTSKVFRRRFDRGIKISIPKNIKIAALVLCFGAMFVVPFFPNFLFGVIWICPLVMLAIVLDLIGVWSPFNNIKNGNWTPVLLFALTYLVQGFLLECWNYYSGTHSGGVMVETHTPAYWAYSVPYVNVCHIFEMPILGFFGYLPFGIYCWVWWNMFTFMLNIPTRITTHDAFLTNS